MTTHFLVYPGKRRASEEQVRLWYANAVANSECNGGCDDTIEGIKKELESSGLFTFTNDPNEVI